MAHLFPPGSGPQLTRRVAAGLLAGGVVTAATGGLAAALPADRTFRVFRKGANIGSHSVRFEEKSGRLIVRSEVGLVVKIAFITAFRYEQTALDQWRDGVLVASRVRTNDDGEESRVVVEAVDDRLVVRGPGNDYRVDLGAMHDLSFWNQDITRLSRLIDAKDGDLTDVRVKPPVEDAVELAGTRVPAWRYEFRVSRRRSGSIWYDAEGAWVHGRLNTRDEVLEYRLVV